MKKTIYLLLILALQINAQTDSTRSGNSLNIEAIQIKSLELNKSGQNNKNTKVLLAKNYLFLEDGKTLSGKVIYKESVYSQSYFLFNDSTRFNAYDVKAFSNDEGYFAKVKDSDEFVKRIIEGKIDLFEETDTWSTPGMFNTVNTPGGSFTTFSPGNIMSVSYDYFSKDGGDVLDADYGNLKEAMSDNVRSVELLTEYRTLGYIKWGGTITGLGFIAAGLVGMNKEHPPKFSLMIIGGAIANLAYWIITPQQSQKFKEAIHVYNGLRK